MHSSCIFCFPQLTPLNVTHGTFKYFLLSGLTLICAGDIMGRALKNLDGLLRMPYGCGEQNIALLAPNIYILQYLKHTDQLTQAILEKSAKFLTSGWCLVTLYYNQK